jgi:hypothetical protein
MGHSARAFVAQTLKDQPVAMSGAILLRYRLSGNSHPGLAKIDMSPPQALKSYDLALCKQSVFALRLF